MMNYRNLAVKYYRKNTEVSISPGCDRLSNAIDYLENGDITRSKGRVNRHTCAKSFQRHTICCQWQANAVVLGIIAIEKSSHSGDIDTSGLHGNQRITDLGQRGLLAELRLLAQY